MKFKLARLIGALLILSAQTVFAQNYPSKAVRVIIPAGAGGAVDTLARLVAEKLSVALGQPFRPENMAGAATTIGSEFTANAPPDGYTMLVMTNSHAINGALRKNLRYDPEKSFSPVILLATLPDFLLVHPSVKANTVIELIDLAKQRQLTFASAGIGSIAHMTGELLAQVTGIKLRHISYSGDAAALPDVMSGRVDFRMGSWSDDRRYVEAGQLKLLSVVYPKRLQEAPNTPTVNEIIPSMAKYPAGVFNSIIVSKAVPTEIVEKISAAMKIALASDSFKQRISALGLYPRYTTPEETDKFLKAQIDTWADIGKTANITFD